MAKEFQKTVGSRAEVWHGTAKKTSGGLFKTDLIMNKWGRIVSKKLSEKMKKEGDKRFKGKKAKPFTKKNKGKNSRKSSRRTRKNRSA
jgi:hypothetical protein